MTNVIATTTEQRNRALTRLNEYVETAKGRSAGAMNRIFTEVPEDMIARHGAIEFDDAADSVSMIVGARRLTIHNNAMTQIAQRTGIPVSYLNGLSVKGGWGRQLLARTLTDHFRSQNPEDRILIRSVNDVARGVLSDRFRRLDARPSIDALAQAIQGFGGMIGDAVATDTRVSIKWIRPEVLEPSPGEFVVYGLDYSNSDYGRGAQTLSAFALRLWCLNGAVMEQAIRSVHLGGRLTGP